MRRIRIGKDINVQWVLHAPTGVVLTSENLTIELKDPKGRQAEVENFTLETQQDKFAVYFALRGTAFSQLGNYTLTAWLNKGEQGQSVVDAVNAFTLVGSTQAEDDLQSCGCGCLNTITIDMQGDLTFVGQPGYSPTANVVKEGDTVTITITDKEGTTTATVKDGKDGDDGISPTAEVSKSGSVVTISITDKDGTHTATVRDGQDGNDGTSPTVTISKSGDTTTLAITDKTGIHIAEIKDGVKGDDGVSPTANVVKSGNTATITITDKNGISSASISDGADGNDGYSPSASVTQTSSGATISVTDKNGTTTAEVSNGTQGTPGVSPAVSIEAIQGGHQVTITDAGHPQGQSFNVMDGQDAPAVTEIFWATYGTTTATEIQTALDAGKIPMVKYNLNGSDGNYIFLHKFNNSFYFFCWQDSTRRQVSVDSLNRWTHNSYAYQPTSHKISSTSSTTPSDSNYYSALATKNLVDAVDAKISRPWVKIADETLVEEVASYKAAVQSTNFDEIFLIVNVPVIDTVTSNTSGYLKLYNGSSYQVLTFGSSPIRQGQNVRVITHAVYNGIGWSAIHRQLNSASAINENGNNNYSLSGSNIRRLTGNTADTCDVYFNNVNIPTGAKIEIWVKYVVG